MFKIRVTDYGRTVVVKNNVEWIPDDRSNSDFQLFLAWCAEGNEPEEWQPESEIN